jgi:predicted nucleotidyltransferase
MLDDTPHVRAASVILAVYGMKIERKLEFAILLANYILIRNELYPVIFHEIDRSNLRYLLTTKSKKDLVELIFMHEYQTRHGVGQNVNHNSNITIDYLIDVLKSHQKHLSDELKVKHLFIYGGIVKGSMHSSSDIDLLVDLGDDMVNFHKYEYINMIQAYLEKNLESKMDVLDFSYSLGYAEIKEMNNTIKIF